MKGLPVVDVGEEKISNVITQSGVVHMLAECVGLHWFEIWGKKKLSEVGLPSMKPNQVLKVSQSISCKTTYFTFVNLPFHFFH